METIISGAKIPEHVEAAANSSPKKPTVKKPTLPIPFVQLVSTRFCRGLEILIQDHVDQGFVLRPEDPQTSISLLEPYLGKHVLPGLVLGYIIETYKVGDWWRIHNRLSSQPQPEHLEDLERMQKYLCQQSYRDRIKTYKGAKDLADVYSDRDGRDRIAKPKKVSEWKMVGDAIYKAALNAQGFYGPDFGLTKRSKFDLLGLIGLKGRDQVAETAQRLRYAIWEVRTCLEGKPTSYLWTFLQPESSEKVIDYAWLNSLPVEFTTSTSS